MTIDTLADAGYLDVDSPETRGEQITRPISRRRWPRNAEFSLLIRAIGQLSEKRKANPTLQRWQLQQQQQGWRGSAAVDAGYSCRLS